jgi:DeoR/GlpR family transcriptional regulator of sugar metabolism
MLAVDRRHHILERVAEQQTIHIGEFAREFGVSEMTIRRDILRLERDGFLRRTYGGATAHITRSLELAFNARALQNASVKRLIGMTAAQLVDSATALFLGLGTTTEQFALFLPRRDDLTVVTESLPIASLLGTRPSRVIMVGGTVRRDELGCVGPLAAETVRRYRADVAVLGAAGISAAAGITELFDEEAEIHRLMIEQSRSTIVLADGSKLGTTATSVVAPASVVDTLVTDAGAPADEVDALRGLGIRVVIAAAPRSEPEIPAWQAAELVPVAASVGEDSS